MSGHPPFGAQVMLNGHEYVACQVRKEKVRFSKEGSFIHTPDATGRLREVCERWIYTACLLFALDLEEQKRNAFQYRIHGSDTLAVLILAHSIGNDHGLWDVQVPALVEHFCIVRYYGRGHGASEAPPGDYSMEQLGRDVLDLADELGIERFAFCGLSLDGMAGQWIAAQAGDRDLPTPWEGHGEVLAREIPGARVVRLAAGHLSNLEQPQAFSSALIDFLKT